MPRRRGARRGRVASCDSIRTGRPNLGYRGAGRGFGGVARLLGRILRRLGVVALTDRDHAHQQRDHRQDRGGADEDSQSPRAPPRLGRLAVAEREPRIDELRLPDGEAFSAREVDGGIEPQPAIEIGVAASILVPSFGRAAQFLVHEKFGPLLCDPGAEARPRAQQRLVHERDLVAVDDEQPGIGECRDDIGRPPLGRPRRVRRRDAQRRASSPPTAVRPCAGRRGARLRCLRRRAPTARARRLPRSPIEHHPTLGSPQR